MAPNNTHPPSAGSTKKLAASEVSSTDDLRSRAARRYKRIGVSTVTSFAARGIAIVVNFATVPLLIDEIGKTSYGFWAVITSITSWMLLFDFGIVNGLVNAVSEANGKDDRALSQRYISSAFGMLLVVSAVLAIGFAFALPTVPWARLLGVGGEVDSATIVPSVAAAFAPVIAGFPFSIARQVWSGYQKAYLANVFAALGSILGLALVLGGIWLDAPLPIFILLSSMGPLLASILATLYLFIVDMPDLRPRPTLRDSASIRRLTAVSVPIFLIQLGALFVNSVQMLILSHRAGLDVAAEYSVLMRLYMGPFSLLVLAIGPFVPTFREAAERGDHAWVRRSFFVMWTLRVGLALFVGLAFLLFGNDLIKLWLGADSFAFGMPVWAALAFLIVTVNHVTAFSDLLTIMDRLWWQVVLVMMNGVATFTLTYWLAGTWGTLGAIVATAAFTGFVLIWATPLLARPLLTPSISGR